MKLSTKGRYAVHALVDIAKETHGNLLSCTKKNSTLANPVSIIDISERHDISKMYLEQLFVKMRRSGLVTSTRGQNGGYILARSPSDISILDIINAVDEPIKTTQCSPHSELSCQGKSSRCLTHKLWSEMESLIAHFLATTSLMDVIQGTCTPLVNTTSIATPAEFLVKTTDTPPEVSHG